MIARRRVLEIFAGWAAVFSLGAAARAAALGADAAANRGSLLSCRFPADWDNDLVQIAGHSGAAKGTVTYVTGGFST